jgi:hypothetical protein
LRKTPSSRITPVNVSGLGHAAPLAADGDEETLEIDNAKLRSRSRPTSPFAAAMARRRRSGLPLLILGLLLVVGIAALIVTRGVNGSATDVELTTTALISSRGGTVISAAELPTATRTPTNVIRPLITFTPRSTVVPGVVVSPRRTATVPPPSATHTASQTRAPNTPTAAPPTATAQPPTRQSASPTAAATAIAALVSRTPSVVPEAEADLLILYTREQVNVINISRRTLNIGALSFVQVGSTLRRFEADNWDQVGAVHRPYSLPSGWCFQLIRQDEGERARLAECRSLSAFRLVSSPRWFWLAGSGETARMVDFVVWSDDEQIARCAAETGRCAVKIP